MCGHPDALWYNLLSHFRPLRSQLNQGTVWWVTWRVKVAKADRSRAACSRRSLFMCSPDLASLRSLYVMYKKECSSLHWGVLPLSCLHTCCYSFRRYPWVATGAEPGAEPGIRMIKVSPCHGGILHPDDDLDWESGLLTCIKVLRNVHSFWTSNSISHQLRDKKWCPMEIISNVKNAFFKWVFAQWLRGKDLVSSLVWLLFNPEFCDLYIGDRSYLLRRLWILTEIMYHTIHQFEVYNSVVFSMSRDMCNHPHSQF